MYKNSLLSFAPVFTLAAALAVIALPCGARADQAAAAADKQDYTLFDPTPADQLRPLSLDANDGVVDPTTVDAGHAQVQGELLDYFHYSRTYPGPVSFSHDFFNWSPRVTLGLLNNVDLFVHPTFHSTSYQYSGAYNASGNSSGYDGLNLGSKINLWGNDSGQTAFSVAPYVSIPNHGGLVLGGGDISFAVRLPQLFYLKVASNPSALDHANDTAYFGIENSLSLHKSFGGQFDAYAYLNTAWESDGEGWNGYAGFGLGYQVLRDLQLFAGIGFGLNSNSYDYNPRIGLGWRF